MGDDDIGVIKSTSLTSFSIEKLVENNKLPELRTFVISGKIATY